MTDSTPSSKGPAVLVPPPLLFVAGFGLAWLLNRRVEFLIRGAGTSTALEVIGVVILAAGLVMAGSGMTAFVRARTAIVPLRRARILVTTGLYRFSRNPMYLGLTLTYLGLAVLLNLAWPLFVLPLVLAVLIWAVIGREERYLRAEFGAAYDAYVRRVRRFL